MINLSNIMNSVEEEEMALKEAESILAAVGDAMLYSPNDSDIYAEAVFAAKDIVRNSTLTLCALVECISNHQKEEKQSRVTEKKGGAA